MKFLMMSRIANQLFELASFDGRDSAISALRKHIEIQTKNDDIQEGEEFFIMYGEYDAGNFLVMGEIWL